MNEIPNLDYLGELVLNFSQCLKIRGEGPCGLAFVMEWVGRMSPDQEPDREFLGYVDDIKRDFGRVTRVFTRREKKF